MPTTYDMIIIGAGTAGLSAAQYAGRSNLTVLVIEGNTEGGQAILIDQLENYPGFADPVSGFDFIKNMKTQAERFGAQFVTGQVIGLGKKNGVFIVTLDPEGGKQRLYESRTVLLATGATHRRLDVPGEETYYGRGVSYCATCDGPFFRDKHIVVVGGGDAACDEAAFLARLTNKVTMIHRKTEFRAQKALAQRTLHNPHISVRFNSIVTEITGTKEAGKVTGVHIKDVTTGIEELLPCDAVFIFVGMIPQTDLAQLAKKDEAGYIITDEEMHTSINGLFAAGDIRSKSFRQIITAAADGAIAAHSAATCIDEQSCDVFSGV